MKAQKEIAGLTTTKAPFIEEAKHRGELFIRQPYELYNADNQSAWEQLYQLLIPRWEKYANDKFLEGLRLLSIDQHHIPKLADINRVLQPLTGFQAKAVCGYVPTYLFFDSLRKREFPTTITIRDSKKLNYLPEPDIFHDVAGHVPMHTDRVFADVLVRFGELNHLALERHANIKNQEERIAKVKSIIYALSRLFWFSIEFGLIRQKGKLKVYGSGIMSSAGEIVHSVESPEVQRFPFQLEWIVNQSFEIHHYQPLLFVIESFEQLYEEMDRTEKWLNEGKLDNLAPGIPTLTDEEILAVIKDFEQTR